MKIVLIGYMGVGKSTIGKLLADELNIEFKDLDEIISHKENSNISEIFNKKGELYFRKKESQYLKAEIENQKENILSLGGGTPCYGNNLDILLNQKNIKTIYLRAQINTLCERLFNEKSSRPLISHLENKEELTEFIGKHLFERNQFYLKADNTVVVDGKSTEEIVNEIIEILNLKQR